MHVLIFKPNKSAMQSGRGKSKNWVMIPKTTTPQTPDPLMGWHMGFETARQIELRFESFEEAIAHAEREGYTYEIQKPRERTIKPKSYASNFTKPVVT